MKNVLLLNSDSQYYNSEDSFKGAEYAINKQKFQCKHDMCLTSREQKLVWLKYLSALKNALKKGGFAKPLVLQRVIH